MLYGSEFKMFREPECCALQILQKCHILSVRYSGSNTYKQQTEIKVLNLNPFCK